MIWFALGVFLFCAGFWSNRVGRTPPRPAPDGLPCPHIPCTNTLPRFGVWGYYGEAGWRPEQCPVCLGWVVFVAAPGIVRRDTDCYVRIPEPKETP